jgi:hypothetical protein
MNQARGQGISERRKAVVRAAGADHDGRGRVKTSLERGMRGEAPADDDGLVDSG